MFIEKFDDQTFFEKITDEVADLKPLLQYFYAIVLNTI